MELLFSWGKSSSKQNIVYWKYIYIIKMIKYINSKNISCFIVIMLQFYTQWSGKATMVR